MALKKRKFDRKHFQKRKRKNLNFKTRRYSTTRKVTTLYEVYASIKTAAWPEGDFIDQSKVMEVGKTLDNTEGVSPSAAFDILDKCAANPELCSFFLTELSKSPDARNQSQEVLSKIKGEIYAELSMSQKEGFDFKAGVKAPIENPDLAQVLSDVSKAKAKFGKVVTDSSAEVLSKGKNAFVYGAGKATLIVVPTTIAVANVTAALNSPTYPESLDSARHNMSQIEEFNSFDSNESVSDRLNKFKRHNSSKF